MAIADPPSGAAAPSQSTPLADPAPRDALAATRPNIKRNKRVATASQKRRMRSSANPGLVRRPLSPAEQGARDLAAARTRQISAGLAAESRRVRRIGTSPVGIANTVPAGYPATPVIPNEANTLTMPKIEHGVALRPAPAARADAPAVLRSHFPIDSERTQQIKALAIMKVDCGRIPGRETKETAAALGISEGHCRRMVKEFIEDGFVRDATRHREKIAVPDMIRLQQAYFMANGDAAKAYRDYLDVDVDMGGASLRTFQRIVNEWATPLRAAAKHGVKGMIVEQVYNQEVIPYRAYAFGMDHTRLAVRVLPDQRGEADFPWLTTCYDLYSGVTLAYRLTLGDPNHETVLDVLAEAVRGSYTADGVFVGGKPEYLRTDRGADFISKAVSKQLLNLDVLRQLTKPYHSWQNGAKERHHREIDTKFAPNMPGFNAGGADTYSRRTGGLILPERSLVRLSTLDRRLGEWFDEQNRNPRKSRGNKTPHDLWRESDAEHGIPVVRASQDEVVYAMSRRESRNLHHYGVEARKNRYQGPVLKRLRDAGTRQVELRYHEHDLDTVEIFVHGKWEGTVQRAAKQTQGQKAALVAMRDADTEAYRDLMRASDSARVLIERQRQSAEGVPEADWPEMPYPEEPDEDCEASLAESLLSSIDFSVDFDDPDHDPIEDLATGHRVNPTTGEITA
ncbi:Mu transposase C-terminal domain-containing protein [Nocardioides ochotonae]|uniref:Mu transposase C-terminal domain-containing protein n=1 Tax=Nocardioides ochotonae TaxID=2685869 RepID=UPI001409C0C8|nr:Mu transposase C-terminal domain-containing protein [Nocardioides ochotonae]